MKIHFLFFLCLASTSLLLSACKRASQEGDDYPRIGVIVTLSGDFSPYGEIVKRGIEKAAAGKPVKLIYEDEKCEPAEASRAYNKLANVDNVDFILGPSCGSPQKSVAPLVKRHDKLMMLMSSATDELYELSGGKMFAPQYSIQKEASFVAAQMNEMGFNKAIILYTDNEFSRAHEEAFINTFDGEIVEIFRTSMDPSHIVNLTPRIRTLDFDSVFIPDASPFLMGTLTQLRRANVKQQAFSVYSAEMPEVLEIEGENAEGLIYSYPDIDGNAISYFPQLGTEIFIEAILHCDADTECVAERLKTKHPFDDRNVLESDIILKTVKGSIFTVYEHEGSRAIENFGEQE